MNFTAEDLHWIGKRWIAEALVEPGLLPENTVAVWGQENYIVAATPDSLVWIHMSWADQGPIRVRRDAIPRTAIESIKSEIGMSRYEGRFERNSCRVEIAFKGRLGDCDGVIVLPLSDQSSGHPEKSLEALIELADALVA